MLLNWCGGFGKQELIYATFLTTGQSMVVSPEALNKWMEISVAEDMKRHWNAVIAVITGELLHEEQLSHNPDDVMANELGETLLKLRHATNLADLAVFKVDVSELWPLVFLGKPWYSLCSSGIYELPVEIDSQTFLDLAVTHIEPTMISHQIMLGPHIDENL